MSWQVGLYVAAVLIPLLSFTIQVFGVKWLGRKNAYVATGAIATCFVLSLIGFLDYFFVEASGVLEGSHAEASATPGEQGDAHAAPAAKDEHGHATTPGAEGEHAAGGHGGHTRPKPPFSWSGGFDWVSLGASTLEGVKGGSVLPLVIRLAVRIDNISVIMFLMVTFIATLIHLYSMGYMHDDPRYPRFFTYLSLFCFSMLGLVASANVFMIFVFWELVGVCSYFLIGFWYEDKKNSDAANKAFVANRVGDVGMLMGLGLIWTFLGTFDIQEINTQIRNDQAVLNEIHINEHDYVARIDPETHKPVVSDATGKPFQIPMWALTLAGLGIFAGCVGKSAQFPLHVWLPDAMAGPTPVSALIHAATMVAAGVYLVGRFYPLFTGDVLLYIAYTGGITLFIAATIAVVQTDYKKVLAYSTVSQLGFMMLALGVGGWAAGLFHLITHAFFKALLFLGAGSVYHSVHTYEMPVLGGLDKKMPITSRTMLLATMAISGVPLFSGFYSKDAILAAAIHLVQERPEHLLLFVLPAVGAMITAFYMFRMWFLVFAGTSRGYTDAHPAPAPAPAAHSHAHGHDDHGHAKDDHGHAAASHGHGHDDHHGSNPVDHAHESEPIMAYPLIALAVPTVAVGWPFLILPFTGTPVLEQLLNYGSPLPHGEHGSAHFLAFVASLIIASLGIGLAVLYYGPWAEWRRLDAAKTARRFAPIHNFLLHKWYFDEVYWAILVRPCLRLANGIASFDKGVVDGLVNGAAWATERLSRLEGLFDRIAVDGLVNLVAKGVYVLGDYGRRLQTGQLRGYLMFLALAVVGLFVGLFAWILA